MMETKVAYVLMNDEGKFFKEKRLYHYFTPFLCEATIFDSMDTIRHVKKRLFGNEAMPTGWTINKIGISMRWNGR